MNYSTKILIGIILCLIIAGIAIWKFSDGKDSAMSNNVSATSEKKTYDGYLVKSEEALYLIPSLPVASVDSKDRVWVKEFGSDIEGKMTKLTWTREGAIEYAKVRAQGTFKGPGQYGHLGKYTQEVELTNLEYLP